MRLPFNVEESGHDCLFKLRLKGTAFSNTVHPSPNSHFDQIKFRTAMASLVENYYVGWRGCAVRCGLWLSICPQPIIRGFLISAKLRKQWLK